MLPSSSTSAVLPSSSSTGAVLPSSSTSAVLPSSSTSTAVMPSTTAVMSTTNYPTVSDINDVSAITAHTQTSSLTSSTLPALTTSQPPGSDSQPQSQSPLGAGVGAGVGAAVVVSLVLGVLGVCVLVIRRRRKTSKVLLQTVSAESRHLDNPVYDGKCRSDVYRFTTYIIYHVLCILNIPQCTVWYIHSLQVEMVTLFIVTSLHCSKMLSMNHHTLSMIQSVVIIILYQRPKRLQSLTILSILTWDLLQYLRLVFMKQ